MDSPWVAVFLNSYLYLHVNLLNCKTFSGFSDVNLHEKWWLRFIHQGSWVAQSVKPTISGQVMISRSVGLSPVGLCADSSEPGAGFGFCISLFLCPCPLTLSLSVSHKWINIKKIKKTNFKKCERWLMSGRRQEPRLRVLALFSSGSEGLQTWWWTCTKRQWNCEH